MEDISVEYDMMLQSYSELIEHTENVISDAKKIKELLTDLNNHWEASAATKFTTSTDEFIDVINEYSNHYNELAEKLKCSHDAYNDFDEFFASRVI